MPFLRKFVASEDGAVTVDWVVLTGAIVAVAALIGAAMTDPVNNEIEAIALVVETTN